MRKAARTLLRTAPDPTATVARLALGAMILPHGLQKLVGAFGGFGFEGTMAYFTETLGFPWILGFLAIVAESVGGVALIVGLAGRLAALGVGSVMLVAGAMHLSNGFFINWYGALSAGTEGWEFHLLALALAAIVVWRSGAASIDARIATERGESGERGAAA